MAFPVSLEQSAGLGSSHQDAPVSGFRQEPVILESRCLEESILARVGAERLEAAMAEFLVEAQCAVLLVGPVVSVPVGILAEAPWKQSGG